MTDAHTRMRLAVRRERTQQKIAANRAVIAGAWLDVGAATVALEAKARRAADWTRALSGFAAVIGTLVALRRALRPGRAGPALRTMMATTALRRLLPTALRLYLRRH